MLREEDGPISPPLELAHRWFEALEARNVNAAAELVSDDCRITNPTGGEDLVGPAGVRELVQMASPSLRRTVREEETQGTTVVVRGLTRVPGVFANFTTWTFETDGERITRLTFSWKPAN